MTDGFIFYGSFMKALSTLPDDERLKAYDAICRYALYGENPECDGAALGMFYMAQPQIDANRKRRENGMKGGRPITESEPKPDKKKPNDNQEETKDKPNDNQEETTGEPKEKVKDKVKVKEKEVKERETRHRHGEYKHVLLTEEQYTGLLERFGADKLNAAIKRVDEYCEETGKTYKNYALVIQRWGIPTSQNNKAGKFSNFPQRNDKAHNDMVARIIAMQ